MPAIDVLEKSPWFASGLRRTFQQSAEEIMFWDNASDFLTLRNGNRNALVIIDLGTLAEEGVAAISAIMASEKKESIILLVNPGQKAIIWEVMQAGCLCYLEKPVSIGILSQLCSRLLANVNENKPR